MSQPDSMSLGSRVWLSWVTFFRVLFDGEFAARVGRLAGEGEAPALPAAPPDGPAPPATAPAAAEGGPMDAERARRHREEGALLLLGLFQERGRLVDFLQQDVASFEDAEVGAAARVVHEGCREALRGHVEIAPARSEAEGAKITLGAADQGPSIKLTGNVGGAPPFHGTLRHRGWRAKSVTLPEPTKGHDATIVCPAEVEL